MKLCLSMLAGKRILKMYFQLNHVFYQSLENVSGEMEVTNALEMWLYPFVTFYSVTKDHNVDSVEQFLVGTEFFSNQNYLCCDNHVNRADKLVQIVL